MNSIIFAPQTNRRTDDFEDIRDRRTGVFEDIRDRRTESVKSKYNKRHTRQAEESETSVKSVDNNLAQRRRVF